nr:hypothetical protein [Tanacetum cinerariifolium]
MTHVQSMLTMRSLRRTNHMLRMLHLLPSHLRDDEEESSEDDEDDEMDIEADEEEEEEHPAPADSIPFPLLPSILSPPSPILSPTPPPSPIRSLGYRAAMIRLRDEAASTSSPPLQLPSASHRRTDQRLPYHLGRG